MDAWKIIKTLAFLIILFAWPQAYESIDDCVDMLYGGAENLTSEAEMRDNVLSIAQNTNVMDLYQCTANTIEDTLPIKAAYLLFGDSIKIAIVTIKTMLPNINIIDTTFENLDIGRENLTQLDVLFKAISSIIFVVASSVLTYITGILLYRSSKDGEFLGNKQEKLWTIGKFIIGATLLIPMEWMGGYSLAQFLMILAAVGGFILAGLIWLFFSIMINLVLFMNPENVINDNSDTYRSHVSHQVEKITRVHFDDFFLREMVFERYSEPTFNLLTNYNELEFKKCLFDEEYDFEQGDHFFQSEDIMKTTECFRQFARGSNSDNLIVEMEAMNGAMYHSDQYIDFALNRENVEYISAQARQIALKQKEYICSDSDIQEMYSALNYKYGYMCGVVNIAGEYQFNGERLQYYPELSQQERRNLRSEIETDMNNLIEWSIQQSISNIFSSEGSEFNTEAKNVMKRAFVNGWFGANSFLMDSSNSIYLLNTIIKHRWDNVAFLHYDGLLERLENLYNRNDIAFKLNQKKNEVQNSIKNSVVVEDDSVNFYIKPIYKMNRLIGYGQDNISSSIRNEDLCLDNFQNCETIPINPLYDMVRMGNEMVISGVTIGLGLTAVEAAMESCYKSLKRNRNCLGNNPITNNIYLVFALKQIFEVASALNVFYIIIGVLFAFVIPVIPYLFFISAVISLLVKFIESILTAQIWAFMFFIPSNKEQEDFSKIKPGFMLMLTLFIQPSLIVLAMIVLFITLSVFIGILNILIAIVFNMLPVSLLEGFSFVSLMFNLVIYATYLIMIFLFVIKISQMLTNIVDDTGNIIEIESIQSYDGQMSGALLNKVNEKSQRGVSQVIGLRSRLSRFFLRM